MSGATTVDAGGSTAQETVAARAYLLVRENDGAQVLNLDEGDEIVLCRSPDATVQLQDHRASRERLKIRRHDGELRLTDLGGRNGTRLNDEVLRGTTRSLRSGDLVRIGDVEIVVAETAPLSRSSHAGHLEVAPA